MEIYRILMDIMSERGLRAADVARLCDLPDSTVRGIINRKQESVALGVAFKLSEGLGVSLERLNGMPEPIKPKKTEQDTTPAELEHIKKYRDLDDHGKKTVSIVLEEEHRRMEELRKSVEQPEEEEETTSKDVVVIPFMRNRASAGEGVSLEDDDYVPIVVDRTRESAKADYAVRVTGRSMEPKYYDGDILLVRKQPAVDIGQIGIFVIGDNGYVKRQQADRLESLNPEYDDIYPSEYDDVRCFGLVLGKV